MLGNRVALRRGDPTRWLAGVMLHPVNPENLCGEHPGALQRCSAVVRNLGLHCFQGEAALLHLGCHPPGLLLRRGGFLGKQDSRSVWNRVNRRGLLGNCWWIFAGIVPDDLPPCRNEVPRCQPTSHNHHGPCHPSVHSTCVVGRSC